jgi:translation initiation factor 3 subunit C
MDNTDRIRTQAILCHIYHHALHDRWFEARDLMLMSHLQESIDHADIPLQVKKFKIKVEFFNFSKVT